MAELTETMIGKLAAAIPGDVMEKIALGLLNISYPALRNIKKDERNAEAVNREILRTWSYQNPNNQVKTLTELLSKAAEDGDVDPHVVNKILIAGQRKKLTAEMTRNLAKCMIKEDDVRDLGTIGFKVDEMIIDAALENNKTTSAAGTQVIKQWAREQEDEEKAYEDLTAILRRMKRFDWLKNLEK